MGVPTADIARLFLVPEATMAARITRAKKRIVGAGIPFAVPDASVLPDRLDTVAQTAYLAFTAGYAPGTGPDLLRADLAGEAIRLVRVVLGLRPDEPTLVALLALTLLQHSRRRRAGARRPAGAARRPGPHPLAPRRGGRGAPAAHRSRAHRPGLPARRVLRLQARIAAEHATAPTAEDTRWDRVVGWYDLLLQVSPSPAARLARAVAVAEDRGTAAGLAALEGLEIADSHRPAAVRAELLSRAGQADAARAAYDQAIAACRNDVERAFLEEQRAALG